MLKLLIVDDEPLALERFTNLLDWSAHGYQLAGYASNGVQALQLAAKVEPDIVFTDIRMPTMDGLALCKELNIRHPAIKVVIVTAYRDFEYAQRAMTYGVTEYLLKNQIDPPNVLELLQRLSGQIEEEQQARDAQQHHYYQSLMLNMDTADSTFSAGGGGQCCCLLLQCRVSYVLETLLKDKLKEISLNQKDIAGLLPAESSLSLRQVVWLDAKTWGLLLVDADGKPFDPLRPSKALVDFWEALRGYFLANDQMEMFALYEVGKNNPDSIKAVMEKLLAFSHYSIFVPKTEIYSYQRLKDMYQNSDEGHPQIRQEIQKTTEAARYGKMDDLHQGLSSLWELFSQPRYDLGRFSYACEHLLTQLDLIFEQNDLIPLKQYVKQKEEDVARRVCAQEIWSWLVNEYEQAARLAAPAKEDVQNRKINQALEYIHQNYQQRLTARSVGEQVGLSEVYFSNLFKKETGATFGDYVTAYRMNVAKYLIMNGDYKIYEIADMTGYTSPQYFSQLFQKETGRTPLEYKKHGDG